MSPVFSVSSSFVFFLKVSSLVGAQCVSRCTRSVLPNSTFSIGEGLLMALKFEGRSPQGH